jgi:Cu2+-exporting ATPase
MSCCLPGNLPADRSREIGQEWSVGPAQQEILLASHSVGEGLQQTEISVPTIHCGGCIRIIEQGLGSLPGVVRARVNLSTRRVTVQWQETVPPPLFAALDRLGYPAHLHDPVENEKDPVLTQLLRALAISGFAAGNVMLFSMSIWAGADPASRDLFHWLSALVSLPAAAYSGQVFFRSAWHALRRGQTNMDVPISIGVLLAFGMSMYDTVTHGEYAYFDAAISLLFFLLIGRVLDHMMRERARQAVKGLSRMAARGAVVRRSDGSHDYLPVSELQPGMQIILAAGERVPVDGRVISGVSDIDCALVNGESLPQAAGIGTELQAGTLNLTAPLTMQATATVQNSFLAEMLRLMEAAESGRAGYRRIADRAAQLYAPVVHIAAFVSFVGWMLAMGDVHRALTIAVAVLIITCPCALALAVPMVQVVAARRLFEAGIMVKDGAALERLAQIDTVVFDKTGTLTLGQLMLSNRAEIDPQHLAIAAAMAVHSRHPQSRALSAAAVGAALPFARIEEHPGLGLEAEALGSVYRLGRAGWALGSEGETAGTVLVKDGALLATFRFDDRLRPDARHVVAQLQQRGLQVEILSGDRPEAVAAVARQVGVAEYQAAMLPGGKAVRLAALAAEGRRVLMVGDGLNDAPALAAAHASMAPATAADIGRNAADFVFLRDSLAAVPQAMDVARQAGKLIRQNFVLSLGYNAIALPFAIAGYITPLIAALVMSSSSMIVVGNALRLNPLRHARTAPQDNVTNALPEGAE